MSIAIKVTRKRSGEGTARGEENHDDVILYDIVAEDRSDAEIARDSDTGLKFPQVGDPHPDGDYRKRCLRSSVDRNGTGHHWIGRAEFAYPDNSVTARNPTDPTKQKLRVSWDNNLISVPVDRDAEGNPILNSAHDPFSNPPSDDKPSRIVRCRRYERQYNIIQAIEYEDTENSDSWVVPGTGGRHVKPGQAHCLYIRPTQEYATDTEFIEIEYAFEIRADGFKLRVKDHGFMAFTTPASGSGKVKGNIVTKGDKGVYVAVSQEVLLNGAGGVLKEDEYGVMRDDTSIGEPVGVKPPKGAEVEKTEDAVFLKYQMNKKKPFAALNLK